MSTNHEDPRPGKAPPAAVGAGAAPGVELDRSAVLSAWWRIGFAAVVAGQSMVFSLAVNLTPPEGAAYWMIHGGLIAAMLGVCVLLLPPMVGEAWRSLRARRITVEQLFLVTLGGALGASLTATGTRSGAVYYEVVSILLAVYAAGKTLGARSRAKALRAVDETRERFEEVERVDGARVAAADVAVGARVRVRPGGAICVDGRVWCGRSFVQETAMTGEWRPKVRGPGDAVLAGTYAVDGELVIEVTATAGRRQLDAVLAAVSEARLAPSELQRQADRLATVFLPLVVLVAAATFGFWTWESGWVVGLFNCMAVLLVACPCALGLATPLAVWQGLGRLAEVGLVARTGDVLDALARADQVCFDKTGTLSQEALTVLEWRFEPAWWGREQRLRDAVAAAERGLGHPIARALEAGGDPAISANAVRIEPGCGVVARVGQSELRVGSPGWTGCGAPGGDGRTVGVTVDGKLAATVELGESWREGAREVFAELRALGVGAEILTGDSCASQPVFEGVEWRSGMRPDEKRARLEQLKAEGRVVVFIGDGINDAPAMAIADTAIAMGGGTALARAASPGVFLGSDLRFLPAAIRMSRAVRHGVGTNLRFAAAYNTLGMVVAAAGWLHPVVAALLMLGSSAVVSVRAMRSVAGRASSA